MQLIQLIVRRELFLSRIVLEGPLNFNSSVNIWRYLSQNQLGSYNKVRYEPETCTFLLIENIVFTMNYKMLVVI